MGKQWLFSLATGLLAHYRYALRSKPSLKNIPQLQPGLSTGIKNS